MNFAPAYSQSSTRHFFRSLAVAILSVFLWPKIRADELHFANGDRISGTFIKHVDGKVYFKSPVLGDITLPDGQVEVVVTPVASAEPPPLAETTPNSSPSTLPFASPTTPFSGTGAGIAPPWKAKIEFGFLDEHGRSYEKNINFRVKAERAIRINDYLFNARYLFDESNQVRNTDKYDASFRWRHDVSPRVFAQTLTSYGADRIKGILVDADQNFGFGYRFLQGPRQAASVGAGVTLQYREVTGLQTGFDYLGELFQDYSYKLNSRINFLENANVMYSPNTQNVSVVAGTPTRELNNHRFRFNATLQGRVTTRFSLNLRYEYEYDNAILDPNARADSRISTTLGYEF